MPVKHNQNIAEFIDNLPLLYAPRFMCRTAPIPEVALREENKQVFDRSNGRNRVTIIGSNDFGVPYGIFPRLLMILLTTASVVRRTDIVDLGSMSLVLRALKTPVSGRYQRKIREQILALSHCLISLRAEGESNVISIRNHLMVSESLSVFTGNKGGIWPRRLTLNSEFVGDVISRPVPVKPEVLTELRTPLLLDLYLWLSWRSRSISGEKVRIRWVDLQNQFASQNVSLRQFRYRCRRALKAVERVYPELRGKYLNDVDCLTLYKLESSVPRRR